MNAFLTAAQPYALEIVSLALSPVIFWASVQIARRTGLDIQQRHRDALHSALMTGARLALAKQLTAAAAIELILGYVRQSVPDAVNKLNPPKSVLENLAKSKIEAVKAEPAFQAGQAIGEAIKQAVR